MRIIVANESPEPLHRVAGLLGKLGHEVVSEEVEVEDLAGAVRRDAPDVAVVAVHQDVEHALDMISELDEDAPCPVVLLLGDDDPALVHAALDRGLDAYADHATPEALQSAMELGRRRFDERRRLGRQVTQMEHGLGRRALVERAKGVLIERHGIGERDAYELIRTAARKRRVAVVEVARLILTARDLLPGGSRY